jgi:hypothetical protein
MAANARPMEATATRGITAIEIRTMYFGTLCLRTTIPISIPRFRCSSTGPKRYKENCPQRPQSLNWGRTLKASSNHGLEQSDDSVRQCMIRTATMSTTVSALIPIATGIIHLSMMGVI